MKLTTAFCASLLGAALLSGGSATALDRCSAERVAAGFCAPVHLVDSERRAYQRGYRDALDGRSANRMPRPPDVALDGKEGFSVGDGHMMRQRRDSDRRYRYDGDRRYDSDRRYRYNDRRYFDRDDYDRRYRGRSDTGEVIDFATDILQGLSN